MAWTEMSRIAPSPPDAVIFDLYETLVTEFDPEWRPGPSVAERLGLEEEAFADAWDRIRGRRESGLAADFPSALREISERLGHTPSEAVIQQLYQERLVSKARPFRQVEDEILQMVRALKRNGRKIGLISNAACEEVAAWGSCALAPCLDEAIFSYRVGLMKPDERVYRLACENLGVLPKSAVFIGDGASGELLGAAEAGLRPYWATWFLDRWPVWKMSPGSREEAGRYQQLKSPGEVISIVVGESAA